jgi:thiopurine S-methyltransferase
MDANFWHQRWEKMEIGFHLSEANPLLVSHFRALALAAGSRVFVPLCGKTLDIAWLLANGYHVAGAELSEIAIEQLFDMLGVQPTVTQAGRLKRYSAQDIDIFVGDIFDLTADLLGKVDAIYDRAALVALPQAMRDQYTSHLRAVTRHASQLLICFEYDQSLVEGPPFSIGEEEVRRQYETHYNIQLLATQGMPDGLKGKYPAKESVWLLKKLP